ncbi:MAG TPA: glycosyltransferase [Gemmatimonadales bacterium]|nr:glycosyltransferase [Gemmatimonadales bacterium]
MRIVMFYHSLASDWNHGNAHFLRGVVTQLVARGHDVLVLEPVDGWSRACLTRDHGREAIEGFRTAYPSLTSRTYGPGLPDLDRELEGADLVVVHEWNEPALVQAVGRHRAVVGGYVLLFHDTHHRSVSAPSEIAAYDLSRYDGVLAFGEVIRQRYVEAGWAERVWTWHEAADIRLFYPREANARDGDLVWIGNWGDEERTAELEDFLIAPVEGLGLQARVHGVRYPPEALARLARARIVYGGWLPNYRVPEVLARFAVTIHIPRRPYVEALPGIPTIRMFEALACGIPLVSAPWEDSERLFNTGQDYLVARDRREMVTHIADLLRDRTAALAMADRGRATILSRHTCAHRVDELLAIVAEIQPALGAVGAPRTA